MPKLTKEEQEFVNSTADALLKARQEAIYALLDKDDFDPELGLPDHKRSGYAERMYEAADFERKRRREEG